MLNRAQRIVQIIEAEFSDDDEIRGARHQYIDVLRKIRDQKELRDPNILRRMGTPYGRQGDREARRSLDILRRMRSSTSISRPSSSRQEDKEEETRRNLDILRKMNPTTGRQEATSREEDEETQRNLENLRRISREREIERRRKGHQYVNTSGTLFPQVADALYINMDDPRALNALRVFFRRNPHIDKNATIEEIWGLYQQRQRNSPYRSFYNTLSAFQFAVEARLRRLDSTLFP